MKKLVLTLALSILWVVNWGYFTMMHRKIP